MIRVSFLIVCLTFGFFSSSCSQEKKLFQEKLALEKAQIEKWCTDLRGEIKTLGWTNIDPCITKPWKVGGTSVENRPLVYAEFGNPNGKNTTLILSMVHSDEITPLYVGIRLIEWLQKHVQQHPEARVILAPLVNPDGLYRRPRSRMNARGVDVNRNFATADWNKKALLLWRERYKSNPRRFPGHQPHSEPETLFQDELIKKYQPQKILSIHAPLRFMDYDGPNFLTLSRFPKDYVKKCIELSKKVNAVSGGFYPGSLGNYAGQEKGIPTLTLELPSANPDKASQYWETFSQGITSVIQFEVPSYASKD